MDARATFIDYVENPDDYWEGAFLRQAEKLKKRLRRIKATTSWDGPGEIAEAMWDIAIRRAGRFPPLFVTGLGGSGSHWVAEMLNEFPDFVNCGEVYFPPTVVEGLESLDGAHRSALVDAIHLIHGWPRKDRIVESRMVNSAAGSRKTGDYKRWEPPCGVIYLIRDPRDQVLSTTFRKDEYRKWVAPDASDRQYLAERMRINRADAAGYRSAGVPADVVVRYEELREDAVKAMGRILEGIGAGRPVDDIAAAVARHDAEAIRAGKVEGVGNLDLAGGPSSSWVESGVELVAPLHATLGGTIESLGYPFGMCLLPPAEGEASEMPSNRPGVDFFGWRGGWVESAFPPDVSTALLARVTDPDVLPGVPVDTLCLSRLDTLSAEQLEALIDDCQPRQLDLGTVHIDREVVGLLVERIGGLAAVNVWSAANEEVGALLAAASPATTVVY